MKVHITRENLEKAVREHSNALSYIRHGDKLPDTLEVEAEPVEEGCQMCGREWEEICLDCICRLDAEAQP